MVEILKLSAISGQLSAINQRGQAPSSRSFFPVLLIAEG
jgi:hypothetical protein